MNKLQTHYDVIVVGGGTAGCSTAYNCGMLGLKTLLIEKSIHLGGTITSGLVVPAMKSSDNQVNTDFFEALIAELADLKGQVTYLDNKGWFNPELTKVALDRLLAKASVDVLFDTTVIGVNITDKQFQGVTISLNLLSVYIAANNVVDTTGNCEIGKISGCEFLEDMNNSGNKFQPVSLRFEMAGVNLEKFSEWILDFDLDRNVTTSLVIDSQIHLSTACTWDKDKKWALQPLFEDAVSEHILENEDRSYFQVFTIAGRPSSIAFNCPRVCLNNEIGTEINPLDCIQTSKALIKAREATVRLANFCKIYLPGFENSYISNIADALGVRVSRRIKGKYVYTVDDLKSGKKFKNPVVVSNYPIDIHSNVQGKSVLNHVDVEYQLPIESLISADFDNLFVAGRCLSADFSAQAALRIQPSCFSMGEGVAKHIARVGKP